MINPFAFYPNESNVYEVRQFGERARSQLESASKDDRERILLYLRTLNNWITLALLSPSLRTMVEVAPHPLGVDWNVPFSMFRANVHLDGYVQDRRCIRLKNNEVLVKRSEIRKTILGSVDEYVMGAIDAYGTVTAPVRPKRFAVKNFLLAKVVQTQENMIKELTVQARLTEVGTDYLLPLLYYFQLGQERRMAVTPLMENGDVFDAIPNLDSNNVKPLVRSMLEGMLIMHSLGLAHRDISPENFLLNDTCTSTVLMDFGLAVDMDEEWHVPHTGFVGKVAYAPPEVWDDDSIRPSYDARKVDVWSLGITVFVMLRQCFPWNKACAFDAGFKNKSRHMLAFLKHSFPSDEVLVDFLSRALNMKPEERPTVDELLQHPWLTGV